MSKVAVVQVGRVYARERELPEGQTRYGRGGMVLAPWLDSVPVVIDHDEARRVGTVVALDEFEDIDGRWITARCHLYPDAPDWIRKGTGASWGYKVARRSSFVDGYVYGAYVEEVTIVQRQTPREPRAKVALLYDKPEPTLEREIIHAPGSTLRRYFQTEIVIR